MAKQSFIKFMIDEDDKKRIENYLASTYKGNMSDFFRRVGFEKVIPWEAMQREEQRLEEEHRARLTQVAN